MTNSIPSRVSIVRLDSYEPSAVDEAVEEVLAPLGGIAAFVGEDARPVLKPNFLWSSPARNAVCTHPEMIRAVARSISTVAPRSSVVVTDSPGVGTATRCARNLGIGDSDPFQVRDADDGIEVKASGSGLTYNRLFLSRTMLEANPLINLPKAKTHGQMVLTAAVKNTFGAVIGFEKAQWHYRAGKDPMAFARLIVQIHRLLPVKLNILDAVVGMEGNGPGSGDPRRLGFLMAGTDAHAMDQILCRIWDVDPSSVYTIVAAREMGLAPALSDIEVIGPSPEELRPSPPWKMSRPHPLRRIAGPTWMIPVFDRLMSLRPEVTRSSCIGCGHCMNACAAKAMTLIADPSTGRPVVDIDYKKCISCFCCQEICPEGAITVKTGLIARMMGLGRER